MKKILKITLILLAISITACDNGFDELNVNKAGLNTIDPAFLLNTAIVNVSYTSGSSGGSALIYDMGIVQQIITPVAGVVSGANFNKENRPAAATLWQNYYPNVIRNTKEAIIIGGELPNRVNVVSMARILQAYAFMVLTDTYGDIPYFEAALGYRELITSPAYTPQEEIYNDIIKELQEATAAFSPSAKIETADVLFNGDISLWRKFGYSLMLRAGMRLSEVNPTKAEATVQAAALGELITTNSENVVIRHDNTFRNGHVVTLNSTEGGNFYLAEPFVEHLKNTNDQRLVSIAIRYKTANNNTDQNNAAGATKRPEEQVGLPIGSTDFSYNKYSQVDRKRMIKLTAPCFLVTAAQTQLLLAEARELEWISTSTVEEYYNAGVRLHMEQMASYDAGSAISTDAIDDYLAENPFDPGNAIEQINTQYWIASFLNGPEAFANFRRSNFPALTPNPSSGQDITQPFITRLIYPSSEISVNSANVQAAVGRMGGETLDTPVWWDAN